MLSPVDISVKPIRYIQVIDLVNRAQSAIVCCSLRGSLIQQTMMVRRYVRARG